MQPPSVGRPTHFPLRIAPCDAQVAALVLSALVWLAQGPRGKFCHPPVAHLPTLELQRELLVRSVTDREQLGSCKPGNETERLPELQSVRVLRSAAPRSPRAVTLVTQLSLNRLAMLENQCRAHRGPIAAVVYVAVVQPAGTVFCPEATHLDGRPLQAAVDAVLAFHGRMEAEPGACALDLQLVAESFDQAEVDEVAGLYPFNAVRNRALMLAQTEVGWLVWGWGR